MFFHRFIVVVNFFLSRLCFAFSDEYKLSSVCVLKLVPCFLCFVFLVLFLLFLVLFNSVMSVWLRLICLLGHPSVSFSHLLSSHTGWFLGLFFRFFDFTSLSFLQPRLFSLRLRFFVFFSVDLFASRSSDLHTLAKSPLSFCFSRFFF